MVQLALLFRRFFCSWSLFFVFVAASEYPKRTENGLHLPLFRRESRALQRRAGLTGAAGLGDFIDVTYSVLVTVGGTATPLVVDTGSSDLWMVSDACTSCKATVPLFPQASFASAGVPLDLRYGDSLTGTFASGVAGTDNVTFAGIQIRNQYIGAINATNTNVLQTGCAGILGLGFALNSVIWNTLFRAQFTSASSSRRRSLPRRISPSASNYGIRFFPDLKDLVSFKSTRRATTASEALTNAVLQSFPSHGPALTRLVTTQSLAAPMVTITLQRNTFDIGGNQGVLSIGELPDGISSSALTWAPIRAYPSALQGPADSPNEQYPLAWELFLDDVYLDGVRLPRSNLSSSSIALSALIDTGNSLLRGPADVVSAINARLGGASFACSTPHTLAFSINGKLFPVDPRDFVTQAEDGQVQDCVANLVQTDTPKAGSGYQYSWSLGDPFIKGVLAAFYYGNITHPSVDPPRIGLLSTVPTNAGTLLQAALTLADTENDGNLFATTDPAPTGVPVSGGTVNGVPIAPVGKVEHPTGNTSGEMQMVAGCKWLLVLVVAGWAGVFL